MLAGWPRIPLTSGGLSGADGGAQLPDQCWASRAIRVSSPKADHSSNPAAMRAVLGPREWVVIGAWRLVTEAALANA